MNKNHLMDRRSFLKITGTTTGGLMVGLNLTSAQATPKTLTFEPNAFLKINADNTITFVLTRLDMGQGLTTGLAMIACDELGADWQQVKIEQSGYHEKYKRHQWTSGSAVTRVHWKQLRQVGAVAREMLIRAAAKQWKVAPNTCKAVNSEVVHLPSGKKMSFGQLASLASKLPALDPKKVPLKPVNEFKLIGKPVKNLRSKSIVTGAEPYAINVKVPGMLYAAIVRCPVVGGKVTSFDAKEVEKMPGIKQVVLLPQTALPDGAHTTEGVAIVGTSTWAVFKAKTRLKVIWDKGVHQTASLTQLEQVINQGFQETGKTTQTFGKPKEALSQVSEKLEVTYTNHLQTHTLMEPLNAVAHAKTNSCELWIAVQNVGRAAKVTAQALGIKPSAITINMHPAGGGFGRRYKVDFVLEAALISKAIQAPVKLTWTREDEIQHGFYHAMQKDRYLVGLDAQKQVSVIDHKQVNIDGYPIGMPAFPYEVPHLKSEEVQLPYSAVSTGAWRSVNEHRLALGQECLMDEIAHKLGKDPVQYRLALLSQARMLDVKNLWGFKLDTARYKKVIEVVAEKANWGKKMPENHAQGLAAYPYLHTNSYAAQVAEVSVIEGELKIHKVTCVVDCGLVINPSAAKAQIEGGIIWGLSALLHGGLEFENGQITRSNYHDNKVLRMHEAPAMEIHFLNSTLNHPTGLGELSTPSAAPAVLNAIFRATGKRIRTLPIQKGDLK